MCYGTEGSFKIDSYVMVLLLLLSLNTELKVEITNFNYQQWLQNDSALKLCVKQSNRLNFFISNWLDTSQGVDQMVANSSYKLISMYFSFVYSVQQFLVFDFTSSFRMKKKPSMVCVHLAYLIWSKIGWMTNIVCDSVCFLP